MKNRNLIVLIVVVAAMAAYIFFFERHQATTDEAREQAEKIFPGVGEEVISVVEVRGPEGTVVLEKTDDHWRLTEPISAAADDSAVSSLLRAVLELTADRRLAEDEVDRAAYDLDFPEMALIMTTNDGTVLNLDVGAKTPLGNNRAVATAEPGVILCSSWFTSHFEKEIDEWRSKDVVELYSDDVASLKVETREDRIEAVRLDDTWKLLEPVADLADPEQMRSLVSELNDLEIQEFIDGETDLGSLGLAAPEYRVTVLRTEGREPMTLTFGNTRDHEGTSQVVCLRDDADIFWVKETIRTRLAKAPVLWRSAVVSPFDTWRAQRLSLTAAGSTIVVDRSEGLWQLEDGAEADYTAVQDRLTKLSELEAVGFDLVDPVTPEIGKVEIGFEAKEDEAGEAIVLTFFAPLGEGGRALVTASTRNTVMSVETAAIDGFLGDLEGLRKVEESEAAEETTPESP